MRYAIISDIHSNIQALNAALKILETRQIDEIVCLGDVVGYNANPSECIDVVKSHPKIKDVVKGNHDDISSRFGNLGRESMNFSTQAIIGARYSSEHTSDSDKEWLKKLPLYKDVKSEKFVFGIIHSAPMVTCSGDLWSYILNEYDAKQNVEWWTNWKRKNKPKLIFFGHSHIPTFVSFDKNGNNISFDMGCHLSYGSVYKVEKEMVYFVNVGAIGQPRDHGVTSYGILDTVERTVMIESLEYDYGLAQLAIRKAGYSEEIADRLDPNHKDD